MGFCMPNFEDEEFDDDEFDDEEEFSDEEGIILACEDCDYRWRVGGDDEDEDADFDVGESICPMCGSSNVLEI